MSFPWCRSLLLPLVGAVVALLPPSAGSALAKQVALGFSLLVAGAGGRASALGFDTGGERFQFAEQHDWIPAFGAHYALGVDGIGLTLVLLDRVLTPVVILAVVERRATSRARWSVNAFFAWMLVLEGLAIGVFAATDVFLFYVLFEATLIPIYFLIGRFGGAAAPVRGGEVPALLACSAAC